MDWFSTVPISMPYLYPEDELISMNGFAFSQEHGIMLESTGSSVAGKNKFVRWDAGQQNNAYGPPQGPTT